MSNSNIDPRTASYLEESWGKVLDHEGPKTKKVNGSQNRLTTASILENTKNFMMIEAQGTATGDIGVYRPIIMPVARRIAPNLLANQIVGIQPMNGPDGRAFAWRMGYSGSGRTTSGNHQAVAKSLSTINRGDTASSTQGPEAQSVVITITDTGAGATDLKAATLNNSAATDSTGALWGDTNTNGQVGGTDDHGIIKYREVTNGLVKLLVEYTGTEPVIDRAVSVAGSVYAGGSDNAATVVDVINDETLFNLVLTNYTGPYTTAQGEALGSTEDDMPTIKGTLESVTVTATTRKLKAEYTIESAQDLKAVHNIDAEAELMGQLQTEIAAEIDRELVEAMKTAATDAGTWNYGDVGAPVGQSGTAGATAGIQTVGIADGRDEAMKFRTLYTRIVREANTIAKTSRRGAGNFIIVSIEVLTALESLNNFTYNSVGSTIGQLGAFTNVGTLDGRFAVYVDTLNLGGEYCLVGYKGAGIFETGIVYLPYVPVMLQKTVRENSFQPVIGAMTRSAILYTMQGTNNYYRKLAITLDYSQLGAV